MRTMDAIDVNANTDGIELTITKDTIEAYFCKNSISAYAILIIDKDPQVLLSITNGEHVVKNAIARNFSHVTKRILANIFSSYLQEIREYVYSSMHIDMHELINILSFNPALKTNLKDFDDSKEFADLVKKQKCIDVKNITRLIKYFM